MRQKSQPPLGDNFRIKPPQCAGGEIARIGVCLLAPSDKLLVHALKILVVHVHFAAHFQNFRRFPILIAKCQWNRPNRPHIRRYILARSPIAPRDATNQHAILVPQSNAQAIELVLGNIKDMSLKEAFNLPRMKKYRADFAKGIYEDSACAMCAMSFYEPVVR